MIAVNFDEARKSIYYNKGYWTKETLLDVWDRQVAIRGDKPYVIDELSGFLTYGAVDAQAESLAGHLQSAGVEEGDVVTFQIPVWLEFAVVLVACLKIGAVMHPVSISYNERNLIPIMRQVNSTAFICPSRTHKGNHEMQARVLQELVPSIRATIIVEHGEKTISDFPTFENITAAQDSHVKRPQKTTSDNVALILSTSGTTGASKAVLLTHNNLLFSERAFTKELQITEHDVMFMPAPLNHATGFNHGLIAPMITGGSVVLQERFDAEEALSIMDREGVTWSMGATPFLFDMLGQLESGRQKPGSLKFYLCGGAPVPSSIVQKAARFGLIVSEVYGSTESCPHAIVPPSLALSWDGNFSGKALPGIEIRVVDENRREVKPGQVGEEASRGPHLFVGYFGDVEGTALAVDDEGWFYSGDLCVSDELGRIRIMGRRKEIIIRGGKNISAVEIDNLVSGCPGIKDHATIGFPDERLGERICLVVVPSGNDVPSTRDVCTFLDAKGVQKRLWPERVEAVSSIPRTESGKVKRNVLAREIASRYA